MAIRPLVTGEDTPVLRTKTTLVPKVTKETLKLLKDMQETLDKAEGLGIAAPQIGEPVRVCIAMINQKYVPLINPEITWKSEELAVAEEGCLSLPKVLVDVPRPIKITLKYLDLNGKQQERRLEEWDARVVQHEVDHLDGVLIVDYQ